MLQYATDYSCNALQLASQACHYLHERATMAHHLVRIGYRVCNSLLASYLSAVLTALQVIEDDITVEQFSGAMTNMVYRCGLMQGGKEVQV